MFGGGLPPQVRALKVGEPAWGPSATGHGQAPGWPRAEAGMAFRPQRPGLPAAAVCLLLRGLMVVVAHAAARFYFRGNCSIDSCGLGVLVGGGEFQTF